MSNTVFVVAVVLYAAAVAADSSAPSATNITAGISISSTAATTT